MRKVSVASSASGSGKYPRKLPFRFSNLQNCLLNLIEPRGGFSYKFDYNAGEGRAEGPSIAAFNVGDPLRLRQVVALHEKICSPVRGRRKRIQPIKQACRAGGYAVPLVAACRLDNGGQGLFHEDERPASAAVFVAVTCSE